MAWKDGFVIEYVALPERQVKCRNCEHVVKRQRVCVKTGKAVGSKYDYPHPCKWFRQKREKPSEKVAKDKLGMRRGLAVVHSDYGRGIVESITDTKIYVTFAEGLRGFSFPGVVEQGKLKRFETLEEPPKQKEPPPPPGKKLLKIGWKVFHKKYGYGRVTAVYKRYAEVRFYDHQREVKRFPLPASVESGMLVVKGKSTVKQKDTHTLIEPAHAKPAEKERGQKPDKEKVKKAAPSKGPKLRVRDGKLVCPICGHVEKPGSGASRCPKCKNKGEPS